MEVLIILSIIAILFLLGAIKIVPQQEAWVMENLGKYERVLEPRLNIITRTMHKNLILPIDLKMVYQFEFGNLLAQQISERSH